MNSPYKRLALLLDQIPNGFPATESGVELKILAKLFTEEEADLACHLTLEPLSPAAVAESSGLEERETFKQLKGMVKKGLIDIERGKGGFNFKLLPFIVGFYERQNADIDTEFARLFEEYYHEALYKMMTVKPSVHRVIPIEKTIPVNLQIMPYDRVSTYLERARSWGVLNCICRVQKSLIGEACEHSLENCLVLSSRPGQFDRTDKIRALTKEEAFEILAAADREGLVHSVNNAQEDVEYICNCCSCSCGVLRGMMEYRSPDAVAASGYVAEIDQDHCTRCGLCMERCHFNAVNEAEDGFRITAEKCYGCGLCVTTCPVDCINLYQREGYAVPAETEQAWRDERAASREKAGL